MQLPNAIEGEVFDLLAQAAEATGQSAYVVGGFVRDFLLQRDCKDIDVVTEGKGIDLAMEFARFTGSKETAYYPNFGTAMVRFGDFEVEFVGARKESYDRGSRKPVVEEGSLYDDQLRRDFTINAMSISLVGDNRGELIDPFGGVKDLNDGVIRTPTDPKITFSDDPLRMMRAIRFATQLDFQIFPETYEAISTNRERISIVSRERITDELNKIVAAKLPSKGFKMLFSTGLLELIFPEMVDLHGVDVVNGHAHKDNFFHTLQVLDNTAGMSDDLWLRWSAILHDIAKPATKRYYPKHGWTFHGHEDRGARMVPKIFKNLRLPLDGKMKFVQKMVKLHLRPIALVDEEVTDAAIRRLIVDAGEDLELLMTLCRADITTRDKKRLARYLSNFDHVEERITEVMERDQLRNWQPPLSGEDIMSEFNIPPSRAVGDIKNAVREAILEGDIPNEREAALEFARTVAAEVLAASKDKKA